jgi:hypothetical protein
MRYVGFGICRLGLISLLDWLNLRRYLHSQQDNPQQLQSVLQEYMYHRVQDLYYRLSPPYLNESPLLA